MNISTEHWASNVAIILFAVTLTCEFQHCASLSRAQFEVLGYTIHRQDYTHSSGGLFIYARFDIPQRRIFNVEINEYRLESLSIEFPIGKVKTIVFCIYKHPTVTNELFKTYLYQMCDSIVMKCNDFVFIGDMNCCPTKSDAVQYICGLYGLTKLNTQPTCFKGDNPTVIDVTLVSNQRRYIGYLNASFGLSAHHNIIGATPGDLHRNNNRGKSFIAVISTLMNSISQMIKQWHLSMSPTSLMMWATRHVSMQLALKMYWTRMP